MKILSYNGSPRGEKGNTHIMVNEFLSGAEEAGAIVENIFLTKKKIKHCLGCFECWTKTPGQCVIKDDMSELITKFIESDIFIFATPLYTDVVTGIMKNFMDRLIPILDPHFTTDEKGELRHVLRYEKNPKIMVISNSGFPGQEHFQVLKLLYRRFARNLHTEVIAEIYRDGGELLRNPMVLLKPLIYGYKKLLRNAGKEVVLEGKISDNTALKLLKPIISPEKYIEGGNKQWDKLLSQNLSK